MEEGLLENNIVVHPLNVPEVLRHSQQQKYGATLLGVPIGADEYVSHWLDEKLKELKEVGTNLVCKYSGSMQDKLLMFRIWMVR